MLIDCFSAGIYFFIANTAFASFIKFNSYWVAAVVLSLGLAPGVVFCVYLHTRWMPYLMNNAVVKPIVSLPKPPETLQNLLNGLTFAYLCCLHKAMHGFAQSGMHLQGGFLGRSPFG